MLKRQPKSLSELVQDTHSSLGRLAGRAQSRLALADHLRDSLPEDLATQLTGCNVRDDGTLIILTSGSEWAARFRFESEKLLGICRQYYPAATQVRIRVSHSGD
jgi:hypothetical protein